MMRQPDQHHCPPPVSRLGPDSRCVRGSGKRVCVQVAASIVIASIIFPSTSFAADPPTCKLPANAVSISQPGAPQGATDVHIEDSATETKSVHAVIHLDLRNDGPAPLSELCALVHLSNNDGSPVDASVALSVPNVKEGSVNFAPAKTCLNLASLWQGYQSSSFDLHFRTKADSVPASGFVLIESAIQAKEPPQKDQGTNAKTAEAQSGTAPSASSSSEIDCVSHAKPLARSFNLLPSKDPCYLYLPLYSGLIVGFIYLVAAFIFVGKKGWLGKQMGGAQWSFGTSFATNFTVGTGLLSLVLGGSVITDALHYMTKTHYVVLSLFFAAILLIAPALFTFFSKPHEFPSKGNPVVVASAAPVWFFLLTSALMVGAVVGQLFTVGLAMDEVRYRGYLSLGTFSMFAILLGGAGIGAFAAALGVVPAYFKQRDMPEPKQLVEKLSSLKRRATSMRGYVPEAVPEQQPLNDEDIILLDHLIAREQVPAKWTMF
jgi:hypothetical protein